jgi:hypothetical protein
MGPMELSGLCDGFAQNSVLVSFGSSRPRFSPLKSVYFILKIGSF